MINSIRNIGIIAHIDAGKTTLTEHFLYYSGKTHKIGEVDEGNTVMDYLEEERKRGITIVSAAASFDWRLNESQYLVHLIDTPGHIDFTAEVERSLRVIDGAVVVFSAVEGVQAQSEKVWFQSDKYKVSKIAFINKLDRSGASFERVCSEIRKRFKNICSLPVQFPVGIENDFSQIVDLVNLKLLSFQGEKGDKIVCSEIPEQLKTQTDSARQNMIAELANVSDPILEFCIEEKPVDSELIKKEIRKLVISNRLVPIFCGSAKKNIGIQPLLEAIINYLPSPSDEVENIIGTNIKTGTKITVNPEDNEFCGLVFKVIATENTDILYMRTYSGVIRTNDTLINVRTGQKVKIKRLLRLYSSNLEAIDEAGPGDIIGLTGLSNTYTGDTICSFKRQIALESIHFPEPVISIAIEPKSSKDKERLEECIDLLTREDPTFTRKKNESTGQIILSGMGELHLEIKAGRIMNDFKLPVRLGIPQVAYRETFRKACVATGTFTKIIGEQLFSAELVVKFDPIQKLSSGLEVISSLKNKSEIPKNWLNTASENLLNGLKTGGNWGYPLIYIKAEILEIRVSEIKTAESAIAAACLDSVQKALSIAGTSILEPIVKVEIICPESCLGEINGYLQSRRAVVHSIDPVMEMKQLVCEVPLSEMFGFSKSLPKISSGRGSFSMEPFGYQEISSQDLEKIAGKNYQEIKYTNLIP